MLSVLGGTLWGSWNALILVSFVSKIQFLFFIICLLIFFFLDSIRQKCSGTGSTICYLLSYYLGQPIIQNYLSERMERWNEKVCNIFDELIIYILISLIPFSNQTLIIS